MATSKCDPVDHDHELFLARARKRKGFAQAYDALEAEYALASELIDARIKAGLTQEAVAEAMGTTKSAVSRLEKTTTHSPSLSTLQRYADAVGCRLEIKFVPIGDDKFATAGMVKEGKARKR
jgi:DNA-binding XRE family transcriptional regulator